MCRLLGYVGSPIRLDALLLESDHSLVVQSHSPRETTSAVLNADGFGVAWYTSETADPALYRSVMPMWGDDNLPRMAKHLRSGCVLANVRSATPGIGISVANTQPFVWGPLAFAHNGYIQDFKRVVERAMRTSLSDEAYRAIGGTSDSEHIFAHILDGAPSGARDARALVEAVQRGLAAVSARLTELDVPALLNVALTDGTHLVAACHAVGAPTPSLYVLEREDDATLVASEPTFSDPGWRPIAPGTVVEAVAGRAFRTHSL
jgi:ergothioneine biosynthesis protein EgtC